MYCPNDDCSDFVANGIRGEYREGLTNCPRCNAALLPGSPPARVDPEVVGAERLVPIASFAFEYQANVAIAFLASNGIFAIVGADDCGRNDSILGAATGGLHVLVRESQAQEAAQLLRSERAVEHHGGA
jgi:hypothetical protein